ncbi:MAG: aminotransferase class I/II-fold pyridoxal phosphate-dependent enzyme [Patescibacteria group bacterium]
MKISTSLVHQVEPLAQENKEIVEPLHTSTIFAMKKPSSHGGFQYGRVGNPTRLILTKKLSDYSQAKFVTCASSGSAAISAMLLTLKSKDEVICHDEVYEGSQRILNTHFSRYKVQSHFIDCCNTDLLKKHLKYHPQTKVVLIETPTNPMLQIIDIKRVSKIAHQYNALLVIDNTFATSLLQRPLNLGADVVIESLSKHVNGHSDVIGGMIAANDEKLIKQVNEVVETLGFVLSPRDAHEVLKGMKTMKLRVDKQCSNAEELVSFLKKHKRVSKVLFPYGKLAKSQMKKSGSIISFNVNIDPSGFLQKLQLIHIAHSLGGVETLIQQPTTMMDLSFSDDQLNAFSIDNTFFRLSVGIESIEDIIGDLNKALSIEQN